LTVLFDTGSANLWVPQKKCKSGHCLLRRRFDCIESSTCQSTGQPFEIAYPGNKIVEGEVVRDKICLGNSQDVCIQQQPLALVTETGDHFWGSDWDGILGLGYDSLSVDNLKTPFANLIESGQCSEEVFALYLDPKAERGKPAGELTLCGIDEDHYEGEVQYVPVSRQNYWQMQVDSLTVGQGSLVAKSFPVIIDSLFRGIYGPEEEIHKIYNLIGASRGPNGGYGISCTQILPDITFKISGLEITLTQKEYSFKVWDNHAGWQCYTGFNEISVPSPDGPLWLLGTNFIGHSYTIFDRKNNRIGFAKPK